MNPVLYHFTCHHGRNAIGKAGVLRPGASVAHQALLPWTSRLVWLTDLDVPLRDALGLTANSLTCDRGAHRYRVTDPRFVAKWMDMRRILRNNPVTASMVAGLESAPGAAPRHWWISMKPVPVVLDPLASDHTS